VTGSRLALVASIVGVLAGTLVLLHGVFFGEISAAFLLDLLGLSAVLTGSLRLLGAFRDDQVALGKPRLSHRLLLGALETVLGILLLITPEGSSAIVTIAGVWAVVGGMLLLADALLLRRQLRGP
jgi:uncharacterized membrane protein HdeD (DUF308 family)